MTMMAPTFTVLSDVKDSQQDYARPSEQLAMILVGVSTSKAL